LEQTINEGLSDLVGRTKRCFVNAGFTVNAETDRHLPLRDGEQRSIGTGKSTAVECYAEGTGRVVCLGEDALDLLEVLTCLCRGRSNLEGREVTDNTAALLQFILRTGSNVIRDNQSVSINTLGTKALNGLAEVEDV